MTHWEVVGWCFALTVGSLLFDFWQAARFEKSVRERLALSADARVDPLSQERV